MKTITSVGNTYRHLSLVDQKDDGDDIIVPLKVNQQFLDELNSCQTREEQTNLFENILSNNLSFDGEVFLISECEFILPPEINNLRYGVTYAHYPVRLEDPRKFERYQN